jgi:hypothetical protein
LHLPVLDFDRLSPLGVQQTQSTFHPHAQQNAFRRGDARQRSRLFASDNQRLRRSLNSYQLY